MTTRRMTPDELATITRLRANHDQARDAILARSVRLAGFVDKPRLGPRFADQVPSSMGLHYHRASLDQDGGVALCAAGYITPDDLAELAAARDAWHAAAAPFMPARLPA